MKTNLWVVLVILLFITQMACAQRSLFFLEGSVRVTGDAEMFFIAPSYSAGVGVNLDNSWSVVTSYTFFNNKKTGAGGYFDRLRQETIDLTALYRFRSKSKNAFFVGGGLAYQWREEVCYSIEHSYLPNETMIEKRNFLTAVFNIGYEIPVAIKNKERSIAIDLKTTGPWNESGTEIFTQVMLGLRFRY